MSSKFYSQRDWFELGSNRVGLYRAKGGPSEVVKVDHLVTRWGLSDFDFFSLWAFSAVTFFVEHVLPVF